MNTRQKPQEIEASATATFRVPLIDRVAGFLDVADWKYSSDPERGVIDLHISLKECGARIIIDTYAAEDWERVLVYAIYPVYIPQGRRIAAIESINRINRSLVYGSLELDPADGEVRIRTVIEAERDLGRELFERAFHTALRMSERWFQGISWTSAAVVVKVPPTPTHTGGRIAAKAGRSGAISSRAIRTAAWASSTL